LGETSPNVHRLANRLIPPLRIETGKDNDNGSSRVHIAPAA
jgi:hypothetical protein